MSGKAAEVAPRDATVLHSLDGGVSWITLNRPEAMNAVTWDQRERIIALLADASADPGVRAVVLTATGRGSARAPICAAPRPPRANGSPETSPGRSGSARSG